MHRNLSNKSISFISTKVAGFTYQQKNLMLEIVVLSKKKKEKHFGFEAEFFTLFLLFFFLTK